jgi:hypothetical protein
VAKVSVLLWWYPDLKKDILTDVGVRADLYRQDRLRSGAAQGRQPWAVEVKINLIGCEASVKHCKWDHKGRQWVVEPLSTGSLRRGSL